MFKTSLNILLTVWKYFCMVVSLHFIRLSNMKTTVANGFGTQDWYIHSINVSPDGWTFESLTQTQIKLGRGNPHWGNASLGLDCAQLCRTIIWLMTAMSRLSSEVFFKKTGRASHGQQTHKQNSSKASASASASGVLPWLPFLKNCNLWGKTTPPPQVALSGGLSHSSQNFTIIYL